MTVSISLDPALQEIDAIHRMLVDAYWSPAVDRAIVAESLRNSLTAIAIDDDTGTTIGIARVVTDRATFAWLCDVIVAEGFRGQGIASRMIEELERHPSVQTVRRWCLVTRDAHPLYERFGYHVVPADRWMEKQGPSERWQTPG